MSLLSWFRRTNKARRSCSKRRQPGRPARPILEVMELEDRTVPTVVFRPVFGNENAINHGGPQLDHAVIFLMFWGSYWNQGQGPGQEAAIIGNVQGMLASPYLSGLAQYGGTTGNALWGNAVNHSKDPPGDVGYLDLMGAIQSPIADPNVYFPRPSTIHQNYGSNFEPIYLAVTPPGVTADGGNNGFHSATIQVFTPTDIQTEVMGVACSSGSGNGVADTATSTLSHEILESMTDPLGLEVPLPNPFPNLISLTAAIVVKDGNNWTLGGANELGDFEPDGRRYQYRVNNALVQAYWSQNTSWAGHTGYFAVPDGNRQILELDPIWSGTNYGQINDLVINGDQIPGAPSDVINISTNALGGVHVTLNGENFDFERGYIHNITINDFTGDDTITVSSFPGAATNFVPPAQQAPQLVINGGPAGSSVHLNSAVPTIVNANGANFYVSPSTQPLITFNGPASQLHVSLVLTDVSTVSNTVTIQPDPANNANVQVLENGTTMYDGSPVSLAGLEIDEGGANDAVNIDASPRLAGAVPITINGGSGTDSTYLGARLSDFAEVPMSVTVRGGSGTSYLNVSDASDPNATTWTVTGNSITTTGRFARTLNYSGISFVSIAGGTASNTFNVQNTEVGGSTTLQTQEGSDQVNVLATSGPLDIASVPGSTPTVRVGSTVGIGGTLENINGPINIANQSGKTSLILDDGGDSGGGTGQGRTVTVTSTSVTGLSPAPITFNSGPGFGVTSLSLSGGRYANVLDVQSTASGETLSLSPGGSTDTIYVESIAGPLSIASLAGNPTVYLGRSPTGATNSLTGINGPVNVSNTSGTTTLNVNDAGDTTARTATVTSSQITGLTPDPISYDGSHVLVNIDGGNGGNTFNVLSTPQQELTLATGIGRDHVNVLSTTGGLTLQCGGDRTTVTIGSLTPGTGGSLANINGPIGISNASVFGTTQLNIDDSGDKTGQTFTLADGSFAGPNPAPINYAPEGTSGGGVSELHLYGGSGGNTFNVNNTSPFVNSYISTGTGNDSVNVRATKGPLFVSNSGGHDADVVGSLAPTTGGTLANIQALVSFDDNGTTALLLDDSGDPQARSATLAPPATNDPAAFTSLSGLAPGTIDWNPGDGSVVTVLGGSGGNHFTVQGPIPQVLMTVSGGAGTNSLTGPAAGGIWNITGASSGTLAGVTFKDFQDLEGGPGMDVFQLSPTGNITSINGGGGSDWLDYSAFPASSPVAVNLAIGSATNVGGEAAGLVRNIQNVWAGAGNTKLTGDAQGNVLVGGAGNTILTGGTGRSVLVGGTGRSQITGNTNDDILIGGTLSPDLNETALPLILAEWQRTDLSYNQRVADLRNGGGLNGGYKLLWGTTVLPGSAADQLTGGGGQDWFFQFPGDTVTDAVAGDVTQTQPLPDGMLRRAFTIGGTGYDDSYNVATDAQGNVYVIGDFQGTVNFNPNGTPVYRTAAAATNNLLSLDGYLAKYSPTGTLLWVQQFATDAADYVEPSGLTVDEAGNVLVDGWITGPTAFGSTTLPGVTGGSTSDNTAAFVAKLDPAGDVLWADQLTGPDASTNAWCWSVTTDGSANVYVEGSFTGTQTIGKTTLTSAGTPNVFVVRLDAAGTVQWVKNTAAVSQYAYGTGIAVDKAGNVYTTGQFAGTGTFGNYSLTSQGGADIFVTEMNSSGTTVWANDVGTPGNDVGTAIVVDQSGDLYLGGLANGNAGRSSGQVYVARLTSTGSVLWSREYGDPAGGNAVASLALDSSGNLYVGGYFDNTITFDTSSFTSAGPANGFIIKLNDTGTVQWAHALIGPGNNYDQAIVAVDPSLNVYAVGNFEQSMNADTDPLGTCTLTSAGSNDGFLLELSQRGPLVYTAPPGAGSAGYTLQLSQGYLQIVDNSTGLVVAEKSVDDTTTVMVNDFSSTSQLTTANLQETISTLSTAAPGAPLVLGVDPSQVGAALAAVDGLAPPPNPITVVLNLAPGTYPDLKASPPAGVTLVIDGDGRTTTIVGHSPALTVTAGTVIVNGMILTTATASPTILVSGGSLALRNDVIQESTGSNQAAVRITGGTVDLGTAADPGLNVLNVNGRGELIDNTGPNPVTALGDTFEHNGVIITSPYAIEDHIVDALYPGGGGLVTYVANNVYVTPRSGSIQRAIDAVPAGYIVNVQAPRQARGDRGDDDEGEGRGTYFHDYTVGSKPLTVAFQNGPTLQLASDSALAADSTTLRVTGGPQDHTHIAFERGDQAGAIEVKIDGLPTGTFAPTGGIVAHGGGGSNVHIEVDRHITLLALLFADGADAHLEGSGGPTVEVGGGGDHTVLEGGRGRNLLIAGPGSAHLEGGSQDDILIGGTVNFGANEEAALVAIIREWARTDEDFATRLANVTGDTSSPDFTADRLNGSYYLQANTTVFDNLARDHMEGGGGNNLYFAALSGPDKDRWEAVIPKDKVIPI